MFENISEMSKITSEWNKSILSFFCWSVWNCEPFSVSVALDRPDFFLSKPNLVLNFSCIASHEYDSCHVSRINQSLIDWILTFMMYFSVSWHCMWSSCTVMSKSRLDTDQTWKQIVPRRIRGQDDDSRSIRFGDVQLCDPFLELIAWRRQDALLIREKSVRSVTEIEFQDEFWKEFLDFRLSDTGGVVENDN